MPVPDPDPFVLPPFPARRGDLSVNGVPEDREPAGESTPPLFWWVRHLAGVFLGIVFLAFGVEVLRAAYRLTDPFSFVMTFFAANFMILISAALVFGLVWRMVSAWRGTRGTG